MAEFTGNDRFSVVRLLGTGGYGNVYEVVDRTNGARKALKALHTLDAEGLFRLKSEFRALVDLAHPNLVRLDELFAHGDQWFMTLELIEGVPLLMDVYQPTAGELAGEATPAFSDYVTFRPGEPPPSNPARPPRAVRRFDEMRLRSALRQLVDALNYLHQAGLCHRDLKPSNVLVEKNGRLVLVDFGLSQGLFAPPSSANAVEGTPVYMSPEQLAGEAVGPAGDWYSVGVMLYEALTGVLPYDGSDLYVALQKKTELPRSPHQLVADLPFDLVQLCIELLSPNAQDRPTGTQLVRRVARRQTPRVMRAVRDEPSLIDPLDSEGESESDSAEPGLAAELLEAARDGRRVIAAFVGAEGSGKTLMLRRVVDRLRELDDNAIVLLGRCRAEESLRFRTIDELVDGAVGRLASLGEAVTLDRARLADLRARFPVVGRLVAPGVADDVSSAAPNEVDLAAIAQSLTALFDPLAARSLLILGVDDLAAGDVEGSEVLGRLLGLLARPAICVTTVASDEAQAAFTALIDATPGIVIRRVAL